MSVPPRRLQLLKIAIVLTALFNLLALLVLFQGSPRLFAVFMFVGQPLFLIAVVLLIGAVVADLRSKELV